MSKYRYIFSFLFLATVLLNCTQPANNSTTSIAQQTPQPQTVEAEAIFETSPKDSERTSWQKPRLIIDQMGDISHKTIADIGAGTGYFSFQLMRKAAKVIATDIDPNMIALMDAFMSSLNEETAQRIETRLAKPNDDALEKEEVDIALFVNVVPYISDRENYFADLRPDLKQDGMVMIVDFKVRRLPIDAPPYEERTLPHILEEELYSAGFTQIFIDDTTLDYQYIITAQR